MKSIFAMSAFVALLAVPAQAATVTTTNFSKSAYDNLLGSYGTAVIEDFESFSEGNVADGWSDSAVGSFSSLGGTGSGGTVSDPTTSGNFAGNDGSQLALRDGSVYGRKSTTATLSGNSADDMFLDSNDTYGIRWDVNIGSAFDRLMFTLTDATDVGATMWLQVGGTTEIISGLGDGVTKIVEIIFDTPVTTAAILFQNVNGNGDPKRNDGFSIDDLAVSAVPLPAGAWLLITGFGALSLMRRRQNAKA